MKETDLDQIKGAERPRFEGLDGLRGAAALIVVLSHAVIAFDFALYTGSPDHSLNSWDIWLSGAPFQLPIAGNLAVCIFFVLSGFVLAGSFGNSALGILALVLKRYVRLAIPIIGVCLLAWAMLSLGWMTNHVMAAITKSAWLDLQFGQVPNFRAAMTEALWTTFTKPVSFSATYDSSLWTMRIEFAGSLLLIGLCKLASWCRAAGRIGVRGYWALFAALTIGLSTSFLGLFLVGAAIRHKFPHGLEALRVRPHLTLCLAVLGAGLGTVPASVKPWALFSLLPNLQTPLAVPFAISGWQLWHALGAVILLVAILSSDGMVRRLSAPLFQWLGAVSFPLYLIHIPLLMVVCCGMFLLLRWAYLPGVVAAPLAFVTFVALTLLTARVVMVLLERPAIRWSAWVARRLDATLDFGADRLFSERRA